ncbi:hypothetical protein H0H81_009263 [Sphagnurus paluster]|uniref:Uncharacterized protein n=1 Tax=Sphagnurus paluster TaxID=117069 RepID=A0A9P7KIT9_9AGAR|nr:hypothetical protein H0H81_009263 [Sphagnurus paluster]
MPSGEVIGWKNWESATYDAGDLGENTPESSCLSKPFSVWITDELNGCMHRIAALLALILLALFLIRRRNRNREQDLFDGNFDPARVVPTAPRISIPDDEDDGMGGRLGSGVGGVVSPFSYVPDNATIATGSGTGTISSGTGPGSPEMRQHHDLLAAAGVAGAAGAYGHHQYGDRYQQQQQQQQQYYPDHLNTGYTPYPYGTSPYAPAPAPPPMHTSPPSSEGGTGSGSTGGSGHAYHGMAPQNPQGVAYGAYPGSAAGPGSVSSHGGQSASTGTGTGTGGGGAGSAARSAKEREAFAGRRVTNPDVGGSVPSLGPGAGGGVGIGALDEERRQAYLRSGPGVGQGQGPIVHRDGGRVGVHPGQEEEDVEQPAEIPPTYDSLPHDERR